MIHFTYHASMCSPTEANVITSMKRCSCCFCGCCCLVFYQYWFFVFMCLLQYLCDQHHRLEREPIPVGEKCKYMFFKLLIIIVCTCMCVHTPVPPIMCVCTHQCHSTYLEVGGQLSVVGSLFHLNVDARVEARISGLQACMTRALTHQTISLGPTF